MVKDIDEAAYSAAAQEDETLVRQRPGIKSPLQDPEASTTTHPHEETSDKFRGCSYCFMEPSQPASAQQLRAHATEANHSIICTCTLRFETVMDWTMHKMDKWKQRNLFTFEKPNHALECQVCGERFFKAREIQIHFLNNEHSLRNGES